LAGIWCRWHGTRGTKKNPVEGEHTLFGFLTTDANATVKPVHAKAMPAILTTPDEMDQWMTAPAAEALELQRPLPDDALRTSSCGARKRTPSRRDVRYWRKRTRFARHEPFRV